MRILSKVLNKKLNSFQMLVAKCEKREKNWKQDCQIRAKRYKSKDETKLRKVLGFLRSYKDAS
jgi:hypothetical protein